MNILPTEYRTVFFENSKIFSCRPRMVKASLEQINAANLYVKSQEDVITNSEPLLKKSEEDMLLMAAPMAEEFAVEDFLIFEYY